ncbi:MAG: ABC transporter ATP-binding protein [Chloroflexi bacterium]|nr:ABC transporter ATP-binding protein [Chloroflexota bacterium]
MTSVALRDVTKRFQARDPGLAEEVARWPGAARDPEGIVHALDGVTLDVADGECIAVLGPSGCGKTTLLRVIAGLEAPDSGTVWFDGQDITHVGAQDRGIGMVFQNYALYPNMHSRGNLSFFFKMHRREQESPERVDAVCQIMGPGFRELLNRRPKELSGGQQQRVAIGRCIIRQPRVFLFDEPLANLDAKLRAQTRVEIKRLIRRFGVTSVYVTHDQQEAIALGDRLVVMRHGRIEQCGPYRELYARPASAFVAGFLGSPSMNLLDGTVEPAGVRLPSVSHVLPLPADIAAHLAPGEHVTVGIRPEALQLEADEASGPDDGWEGEIVIDAQVIVSEPLIAERQQLVRCALVSAATATPAIGLEITAKLSTTERFAAGQPLRLTVDPADLHVFTANGLRIAGVRETTVG